MPNGTGRIVRPPSPAPTNVPRGTIRGGMSKKARLRAAFRAMQAPHPWEVMVTLTFEGEAENPHEARERWWRRMARFLPKDVQWFWLMEWTQRGNEHFHVFLGNLPAWMFSKPEVRIRHGKPTTLLRGAIDWHAKSSWHYATRNYSPAAVAFNSGGIVERLRSPDAAARYVAKEACKRAQKQAPDGRACGRTWGASYVPESWARVALPAWVVLPPYSQVWDAQALLDRVAEDAPPTAPVVGVRRPDGRPVSLARSWKRPGSREGELPSSQN